MTLAVPAGLVLENVTTTGNPSPRDTPPGVDFPVGFLDYAISNLPIGASTVATVYLEPGHNGQGPERHRGKGSTFWLRPQGLGLTSLRSIQPPAFVSRSTSCGAPLSSIVSQRAVLFGPG